MFIGKYYHRLESKGRVSLPVKFRDAFASGAVITRGLDGCLAIFDQEKWKQTTSEIENLIQTKKANRDYVRFITNDAQELEIDGQGRIRIDESLQERAKLSKEIVFVGTLDHVEVWDRETYHTYSETLEKTIEEQVEKIATVSGDR